jgi:hypothetical protein
MQISSTFRQVLRRCGTVILMLGICTGAYLYWSAPADSANAAGFDDDSSVPLEDTRRYAHDTAVNFGKVGLLVDGWLRAAGTPKGRRNMGITVIVISGVVGGGLLAAGSRK